MLRDVAVMLADGGDCLSDLAVLRDEPELFGPVASTPTAWRVLERTAKDPCGLARLRAARAQARGRAWAAGGDPDVELLIVDADATLVLAHSDSAGGSGRLAWHLRERQVGFSLGMQADAHVRQAIFAQPEHVWTPAAEPDGQLRSGAEVCELTGWVDLGRWPDGTRVICRKGDAHPAANSAR